MNIIKEFFSFRRMKNIYQKIDITKADKVKLDAFDNDLLNTIYQNTMNRLVISMINGDLSQEEVRGAKYALHFFKGFFKEYNINNK